MIIEVKLVKVNDQRGGSGDLHVGHSNFTSIQFTRHSLWKKCEQGVFITPTPFPFSF